VGARIKAEEKAVRGGKTGDEGSLLDDVPVAPSRAHQRNEAAIACGQG